jgi:hypothetical protein
MDAIEQGQESVAAVMEPVVVETEATETETETMETEAPAKPKRKASKKPAKAKVKAKAKAAVKKAAPTKAEQAEELDEKERQLRRKYPRIVEGSIRPAAKSEAEAVRLKVDKKFVHKITVEIRCATKGCPNVRRVATSDLAQVRYCEACTIKRRLARRKAARQAAKKSK